MKTAARTPGVLVPGAAATSGWTKSAVDQAAALQRRVQELKARLVQTRARAAPAAVSAHRVFTPEAAAFTLAATWLPDIVIGAALVNYVVRDGVTHDITMKLTAPGAFVAERLKVSVLQRLYRPGVAEPRWLWVPSYTTPLLGPEAGWLGPILPATPKVSLPPVVPQLALFAPNTAYSLMSFFWNLLDQRGGRALANDLVGDAMLAPRTAEYMAGGINGATDGGWYEFDVPWVFQSGAQLTFQLRPITPILQYDSSINTAAVLGYDDRENGVRDQSVKVSFELHGYRFDADLEELFKGDLGQGVR